MKRIISSAIFSSLVLILSLNDFLAAAPVERSSVTREAEIVTVKGDGWVRFIKEKDWLTAVMRQILTSGDYLKTGTLGKLDILFNDGTQIKMHSKSILLIKEVGRPAEKKGALLGLEVGEVWSRAKSVPEGLRIETPSATAAIRGTDWDLVVDEKGASYLTVLKGTVELFNDLGKVSVAEGEQAMAEIGKPPVKMFLVKPKDRVQWIVSYPMDFTKIVTFHSHRSGDVLKVLPSVREKVEKNQADTRSKLLLAGLLFDIKRFDESMKLFDEILAVEPANGRALAFKGFILLERGRYEDAAICFEQAVKILSGREKSEALIGMAGVYVGKNDLVAAEKLLEGIGRTDTFPAAGIALTMFRAYSGDFRKAVEICSENSKKHPDDERFFVMAAGFYLALDESAEAFESAEKALLIYPDSSAAHAILGRYHYLEGRGTESKQSFTKAIELDPENADARSELGKLLMERGYYEESLKELTKAIDIAPRGHVYLSKRGMLMNWLEDITKAGADYKNALELNPSDYQSLDGVGFLKLKEGKTKEAIEYFQKTSLLEPGFAEPHVFLAVAYYQTEDFERALDELRLAASLDPKDPLPHIMSHLIYQDTYRPLDSVRAASKALELLPNLKSVNPIEATQKGLTNLGSSLLGLGMTEWATSYAEESFNPYDASSYFFVSQKYDANPFIYVSQNTLGFLLNPISIRYSDRYQDIVPHPQHNFTVRETIGKEDGRFSNRSKLIQQGYFRDPFEMTYLVDFENHEDKGFRENAQSRGNFLTLSYGARPDYKNGFMIWAGFRWENNGEPGPSTKPDYDDKTKMSAVTLSAGYNRRLGHNNNILVNFSYGGLKQKFKNADPLGSTISNTELSFINRFGLDQSMHYFEKGVYDLGLYEGMQIFSTDSTGILKGIGLSPLLYNMNPSLDVNNVRSQDITYQDMGFQIRHLFDIGDNHHFTYGFEYIPTLRFKNKEVSSMKVKDVFSGFFDEIFLENGQSYLMYDTQYADVESEYAFESRTALAYLSDRWKPTENLLLEAGVTYEYFKQDNTINNKSTNYTALFPKAGIEWKFDKKHIIRAAYQKHVYAGTTLSLAPLPTAGLFYEWIQLNPGAKITDYQIALESRWSQRIFTLLNVERRDFEKIEFDEKNRSFFYSAALNAILTDRIGFFVRYKHADSENENGLYEGKAIPLLPKHAFGTGIIYVSPSYFKAALSTYYITDQFGDSENTYKLPDFWITDFNVTWEPFRKHWMFKLALNNIFDRKYETQMHYPAAGRSFYVTAEYRF